jgi:hypothetical protein
MIWKILLWFYKVTKKEPLKSTQGKQIFIWGSNTFMGCPNILVVANEPIIKVESLANRLYLSVDFYDRAGKLVMKIVRNKVKLNQNNIFEVQEWRKDKLKIMNQYQEPIEITVHKTGEIELNGVFYCNGNRLDASPSGLRIN